MNKLNLFVCTFALVGVTGCGAVTNLLNPDAGELPDLTAAPKLFLIEPGAYKIVSLTNKTDACMIDTPETIMGTSVNITNDNMGTISIKGYGQGMISNNVGTLALMGHTMIDALCSYDYAVTNQVTLSADDDLVVNYAETDSNRMNTCSPMVGTTCMTGWTMELQIDHCATDGDCPKGAKCAAASMHCINTCATNADCPAGTTCQTNNTCS